MGMDSLEVKTMSGADVDPALRTLWAEQLKSAAAGTGDRSNDAPLGMDDDRYQLHTEAKQLARARCDANPRLDPAEEYADAAVRLLDRDDGAVI
jgi:hypothetical protein